LRKTIEIIRLSETEATDACQWAHMNVQTALISVCRPCISGHRNPQPH